MYSKVILLFFITNLRFATTRLIDSSHTDENGIKKHICPLVCINNLNKNMTVEIGMIQCNDDKTDLNLVQGYLHGVKNICANVRLNQTLILLSKFQNQENAQTETILGNTQITCTFVEYPLCYLDPMISQDFT